MDAISLLEEDHRKMKKLLSELESTTERGVKTRQELFATVKDELEALGERMNARKDQLTA